MFTPADVENLKLIYHLVKEKGMTLNGAEKRLKENREGLERNLEVIDKLQGIKALLLEIKQELKTDNSGYEEILIENDDIPVDFSTDSDKMTVLDGAEKNVSDNIPEDFPVNEIFSETPVISLADEVQFVGEASPADAAPEEKTIPRIIEQTLF